MKTSNTVKVICVFLTVIFLMACISNRTPEIQDPSEPLITEYEQPMQVPPPRRLSKGSTASPVTECIVEGSGYKIGPGIFISESMARDISTIKVDYQKVRDILALEQQLRKNERAVLNKTIQDADDEVRDLREKNKRSWWEKHGAQVTLIIGAVAGIALTIGVAAALDGSLGEK